MHVLVSPLRIFVHQSKNRDQENEPLFWGFTGQVKFRSNVAEVSEGILDCRWVVNQ